jgi:hypothetical protein
MVMMDIEQHIIDIVAKKISDSIDKEVLYNAMGWTIVNIPHPWYIPSVSSNVKDWLKEAKIEYDSWDSKIAFKEGSDATFFLLRWT